MVKPAFDAYGFGKRSANGARPLASNSRAASAEAEAGAAALVTSWVSHRSPIRFTLQVFSSK